MFQRSIWSVLAWAAGLCGTAAALGQTTRDEVLSKLLFLEGPVVTYYPAAGRDRAENIQHLTQEVTRYYAERTAATLTVRVALVGRSDVAGVNPPFTRMLPGTSPGPIHTVVVPIGRGHALDIVVQQVVHRNAALQEFGLSADELSDKFTELTMLHDLGHRYARAGVDPAPGWYSEFVASYLAYSFLTDRRPEDAHLWTLFCRAFLEHITPNSRPIGDAHVLAGDYAWYLGSLQQRVSEGHARYGRDFPQQLRAAVQEHGSASDWESARRLLERASPGFDEWSRQHHRD